MLSPVELALSLYQRSMREAARLYLDAALSAELDELDALALDCSNRAD